MYWLRRFWVVGLVALMVMAHAAIIGYVRSQVSRLKNVRSSAVTLGDFRFQSIHDKSEIYHFRLHAVVDPVRRLRGEELLGRSGLELREAVEQSLRQVDPVWLGDPKQDELRRHLQEVLLGKLDEPVIERVVITDWLQLPTEGVTVSALPSDSARVN